MSVLDVLAGVVGLERVPDCLLYSYDAAEALPCVDLGRRPILVKKTYGITPTRTQV